LGVAQLTIEADSSGPAGGVPVSFRIAEQAVAERRLRSGTASSRSGVVAEAATPVIYQSRAVAVILYSAPVSDIINTVTTVRHEILVAGGIAVLLALVVGYLVARALTFRLNRLELAANRVAA